MSGSDFYNLEFITELDFWPTLTHYRAGRVQALARDIVLCPPGARHFTLTDPLSTGLGVQTDAGEFKAGGNPAMC